MSSLQGAMDTDTENSNLAYPDQPMVEVDGQGEATNMAPNEETNDGASSVPDEKIEENGTLHFDDQADFDNTSTRNRQVGGNARFTINPHINDAHLNMEGRQIDTSTLTFDRIPDMYVRVSNRITHPAVFELICTRFFLESWRGEATVLPSYNDITLEHELLPGYHQYCATPDCDCED